eukprot:CAMPEP_0204845952 /NCGR_PEP_ID=MMETSP1347-20130617/1609_1 /ASSEMBLY_ACC=CAM_ASM_000690 /TAXON_ID=215587 /ORGANISM="Aplanochytrium stocchinoi, Strain GSBS06" /LENGTH=270 /DNA_ID=CAMNT_0051986293 /DNA_START=115 /DNA_END=927 /DNA_ORIENTATION=-
MKVEKEKQLLPLVYDFLIKSNYKKTAAKLVKESKQAVSANGFGNISLQDVYDSYINVTGKKRKRDASGDVESTKAVNGNAESDSESSESENGGIQLVSPKKKKLVKKEKKKEKTKKEAKKEKKKVKKQKEKENKKEKKEKKKQKKEKKKKQKDEKNETLQKNEKEEETGSIDEPEKETLQTQYESQVKKRFQRVDIEKELAEIKDERLKDNTYDAAFGKDGWGAKASEILLKVRGRGFRHEKTKKKRGGYRGGLIDDNAVRSIKFNYDSE